MLRSVQYLNCSLHVPCSLCAAIIAVSALDAQTLDPTRFGEGIRPLAIPKLFEEDSAGTGSVDDSTEFAPESPGDDDLGQQLILQDREKQRWLSASADLFTYWTDNAANLSTGEQEDFFLGGQVSIAARPRISDRLYGDAFISQQFYRYDENDILDYEYFQAGLGVFYQEPRLLDSVLFFQGQYGRTTADNFSQEVYDSFSLLAGIQKSFVIDHRNSLALNLMGDWDLASDNDNLIHGEYIADISYRHKLMRDLFLTASYRFTWFDYYDVDRSDALNTLGAFVNWTPKPWLNVYLGTSMNFNESDVNVFDYQTANIGGGVGVTYRF